MRHLLDVNVLIALIDPSHIHHESAQRWFASIGQTNWLSCPMTENGVIRIVSNPRYPNQRRPQTVCDSLDSVLALGHHEFVPDSISLLDDPTVDRSHLLSCGQVTDSYLLALALRHGARLATFDKKIVMSAVRGGASAVTQIR